MELKLKSNTTHIEIASKLLHARTQLHVYHLQTKSYSIHKALNETYEEILNLTDSYIETIQGKLGTILTGYKTYSLLEDNNPVKFLSQLKEDIESYRINVLNKKELNNIDNQCQVIVDLIESSIYKLKFLA